MSHRKHPRYPAKGIRVRLFAPDKAVAGYLGDLSAGGLFARIDHVFAVGTSLKLDLSPPGWTEALKLTGKVANRVETAHAMATGTDAGVGVAFDNITPDTAGRVAQLLKDLGASDMTPPAIGDARLMVQIKGVLLDLGEVQQKLAAAEREVARLSAELDDRSRRIALIEEEKAAVETVAEMHARKIEQLEHELAAQHRRAGSGPTGAGESPAKNPSLRVPEAGSKEPTTKENVPPPAPGARTDPFLPALGDIAEAPPHVPEPVARDTVPGFKESGADSEPFIRRLNAGEKVVQAPGFSIDALDDPTALLVASWVEKSGTLAEFRRHISGWMGEARLVEILLYLYRRSFIIFERR